MSIIRKAEWRTPNHMFFQSGHKTFDRQVDCIDTGNVIGSVQFSSFIRAATETECNGFTRPKGHLRDYDLNRWWQCQPVPQHIRTYVRGITETMPVILYQFHHWANGRKIVHGYVITTTDKRLLKTFYTGPTFKSELVINEAVTYIAR